MKIRFLTKSKSKMQNILVRIYHSKRFDLITKTEFVVMQGNFSNSFQKVKNKSEIKNKDKINNKLTELRMYLSDQYNDAIADDIQINSNWLKTRVNTFFNRTQATELHKKYLIDWAVHYNTNETINKETGKPLAQNTLKKYKTGLNCFKEFEEHRKHQIILNKIDYSFYKEFINYCINIKKYAPNTIGAQIKVLKTWLKESNKLGFSNVDFSDFKALTNEADSIYLKEEEINAIYNCNLENNKSLDNIRDLFIVGLRTGLRVSDFLHLDIANITNDKITIKTQKTNKAVIIPLHSQLKCILNKYNNNFPKSISEQKFNKYVKLVCKEAGLEEPINGSKINPKTKRKEPGVYPKYELITSHICRRSFATNLYDKIDSATIMAITGHKTEREFLKYIKTTPQQHANKLEQLWNGE